jgi:predicted XRE-type DNA-binding protein
MVKTKVWRELRGRSKVSPEQRSRTDAAVKKEVERLGRVTKIEQLRRARSLSQQQIAEQLGTNQGAVSRLERQTDFYLSTLGRFVHALGGTLKIVVQFDDAEEPIELDLLGDLQPPPAPAPLRKRLPA